MKIRFSVKTFIISSTFIVLSFSPTNLSAQHNLIIKIAGLNSSNGQILLEFSNGKGEKISGYRETINKNQCSITINNLKSGSYSFKYFHDENKNNKLDTNFIGIPKEGFGFSNNAMGKFGPPDLNKTIFQVKSDTTQTCTIHYF